MLHNIHLTNTELDAQVKTIIDFLTTVHPELVDKSSQDACVELRPINRSPDEFNIILNRSLNLWRLDENAIDRLKEYLFRHNGEPYCMYYSVFSFDYGKDSYTKAGKKAVKGKITSSSALFTNEIVLDFDNINYMGFEMLVRDIEKVGFEALWVFTGHGYQMHILLDEPLYGEKNLFNIVHLFRAKGFMCDTACVDTARLMRLPFTYNCKCFSSEEYDDEYNNPPLCRIVKETKKRYSFEDIVSKLTVLPTISAQDEKIYLDSLASTDDSEDVVEETEDVEDVSLNRVEYPDYLDIDSFPEPVVKMLRCTPHGFRNETLGFLIGYFKKYILLGKQQIFEVLNIWNSYACEPPFPQDIFIKDFERLYQGGGLPYSSRAVEEFGFINFETQLQLHRDNKVLISNTIFQSLDVIDGNVLRAYLAVKILEHGNGENDDEYKVDITINALADVTGMSIPTLKRVLPVAKKINLLYVKQGVKKKGEPNTYHSFQINKYDAGFKALSVNDLDVYLSTSKRLKLTDNELKLYLFMLYKFYTKDRAMSLKKMGAFIGLTESAVSKLVTSLSKKRYLKVERIYKDNVVFFNKYTLLK